MIPNKSYPGFIKHLSLLTLVLAALSLAAVYYSRVMDFKVRHQVQTASQLNFSASQLALKIKEKADLLERSLLKEELHSLRNFSNPNSESGHRSMKLISQLNNDFNAMVLLHRNNRDPMYSKAYKRIGMRIYNLREEWINERDHREKLLDLIQFLRISCDQAYRLHLFAYQNKMKKIYEQKISDGKTTLGVIAGLFLAGLLILRQMMKQADFLQKA